MPPVVRVCVTAVDASIPPVVVDSGVTTVPPIVSVAETGGTSALPTAVTVSVATMTLVTTAVACPFEVTTRS